MNINPIYLGTSIKKYRKQKGYSTQELAKLLNVSTGLVNNIENAKNDVFKLKLLINLTKILNIPLSELFTTVFNDTNPISLDTSQTKLEITLKNKNFNNTELLSKNIKQLINSLLDNISYYENQEQATKVIFSILLKELDSITQIKELK